MKRMLILLTVCCFGGVALALNIPTPSDRSVDNQLIVHEWGTFTGFVGSDGVHIPFGTSVGNDLPQFVLNRREQATRLDIKIDPFWIDAGKGGGVVALQRMETPVIYFYTPQPREVSVAVDFPQGLLTEFYPPVRSMGPAYGDAPGEPRVIVDSATPTTRPARRVARLERGSLDWGAVRIVPQSAAEPTRVPEVPKMPEAAAHYRYARETDAATVQFSDRPGERYDERFLFYRGLGDFTLPVKLTASGGDRFEMNNVGEHPISFALLLRVQDGRARFAVHRDVTGRRAMTLPAETFSTDQVGDAIVRALVAEGLFEREARAMVKTWSSNWLGEPGTRLLYTVPRAVTDGLLPLRINPTPDRTVRVLVGRIDVMTPEQETKVQSLLATSLHTKSITAEDAAELRSLGRFLNPAIERAARLRGSPNARQEINVLRSRYHDVSRD